MRADAVNGRDDFGLARGGAFRDPHLEFVHGRGIIYGLCREAWERALEEVLLGGIVERIRPGVQTRQVSVIADTTVQDCRALESASCSASCSPHSALVQQGQGAAEFGRTGRR